MVEKSIQSRQFISMSQVIIKIIESDETFTIYGELVILIASFFYIQGYLL